MSKIVQLWLLAFIFITPSCIASDPDEGRPKQRYRSKTFDQLPENMRLEALPDEILCKVMKFLDLKSIGRLSGVNHHLNQVANYKIDKRIPEVAQDYKQIYLRFLHGKLIYRPDPNSDKGKIELPISALANPLEGTFDLSRCGDTEKYLSIATGYRKGKKPENANKIEIWFTPRFFAESVMPTIVADHYLRTITTPRNWDGARAPVGIFWTWGGWNGEDIMSYCNYLTTQSIEELGSKNLSVKYEERTFTACGKISYFTPHLVGARDAHTIDPTFHLLQSLTFRL